MYNNKYVISLITGDNSFERYKLIEKLSANFDGSIERIDGTDLEAKQLPDLLMGATLFADKRMVIVRDLSENKSVWSSLPDWIPRLSDDIHLVLVDQKPDKRTATYKALKADADIKELNRWSDRYMSAAMAWTKEQATILGINLDAKKAQQIIERSMISGDRPGSMLIEQWDIYHALEKLAVMGVEEVDIDDIIDPKPTENVFNLLDAALSGNRKRVKEMLQTLELTEDPYMVFGLLSSQVFQLAALAATTKPSAEVAKDIGAHPFALQKLAPHARKLGRTGARKVVTAFSDADMGMKSTATDPWIQIERALYSM